jgi:hypothetical protein
MALQQPTAAFAVPELREAEFKKGRRGLAVIAGSSAVVFHATIGGHDYALRCYTREDASTLDHYAALGEYVARTELDRYVSRVRWMDQAVQVKGGRWPVLTMEWINGRRLNDHVGDLATRGDTAALRALASQWLTLVGDLQEAQFAHGDLQHGNILVDGAGGLRLVDFDSVWIPPLRDHLAPTETGHPSYQPHWLNPADRWGPYMDTFPGLVIYLALLALSRAPGLWDKLDNGDNLLFERADFAPPHHTEVWALLAGVDDLEVDQLAAKLKQFCAPDWTATATLRAAITPNWWERTGKQAVQAARPGQPEPSRLVGGSGGSPLQQAGPAVTPEAPGTGTPSGHSSLASTPPPRQPTPASHGTWWDQAAGSATPATGSAHTPAPQAGEAPADGSRRPVAPRRPPRAARRGVGVVLVVLGLLVLGGLSGAGAAPAGLGLGAVLVILGILLAAIPGRPGQ